MFSPQSLGVPYQPMIGFAILRKFSPQNGHFLPIRESFLPRKFPAIWYILHSCGYSRTSSMHNNYYRLSTASAACRGFCTRVLHCYLREGELTLLTERVHIVCLPYIDPKEWY